MTIPEIRKQMLGVIAGYTMSDELRALITTWERELHRRPPARTRAEIQSAIIDRARADLIRRYAAANPDAPLHDIAHHFNVNPGRVSEALGGKRT